MSDQKPALFIERRHGRDRRKEPDSCKSLPIDLYHRKRRKNPDRRTPGRTLAEHINAFYENQSHTCDTH
ncbi:hypothetical protein L1F30_09465 [Simiduia sp. 21SJ11W-1]|uniref:hypothetical protein n=1 Tax=Simiduia sp. 21SJ11W-1 TaxID=2909669 RepID=UPI00209DA423|nr:hypothetical protein [Simiduia sp. 21SJ11W-1]UTA46401.1 hypothetical protein L1F30_09465 [Simiduia sp. 21SJ11W-1]